MPLYMEHRLGEPDERAGHAAVIDRQSSNGALSCRIAHGQERRHVRVRGSQTLARLPKRSLIDLAHPSSCQCNRNPLTRGFRLCSPRGKLLLMAGDRTDLVHLRRIDPHKGMSRFYSLSLQPCLLGGVDLVRRWGRMGTIGGSTLTETFPDEASAQAALEKLAARKRRRGYA